MNSASLRSVGPDKLNQLRQVRFLKDLATMKALMEQHRLLLKPRFDRVEAVFRWKLGRHGFARWTRPNGGYFVSLEVLPGTAIKVVELAAKAGVIFASPGSCFPYGIDFADSQLRIAPSMLELEQLDWALAVIATCVIKAVCSALKALPPA